MKYDASLKLANLSAPLYSTQKERRQCKLHFIRITDTLQLACLRLAVFIILASIYFEL